MDRFELLVTEDIVGLGLSLASDPRLWLLLECISNVEVIPDIEDSFSLRLELESPVALVSDPDGPVGPNTEEEELSCCDMESRLDCELLKSESVCV